MKSNGRQSIAPVSPVVGLGFTLSNDDCSVCWTSVGGRVTSMKSNGRQSIAPVSPVVGLGLGFAFAQVQSCSGNGVPQGLDLLGWGVVGGDGSGNWVLDESAADGVAGHPSPK